MYKPLSLYIGLRYTKAKRKNGFISFISLTSMLGIALGVMVLITVLSVMNGFDFEIHKRFFGMAPEVTINSYGQKIANWQNWEKQIKETPGVLGLAPFVGSQGLISYYDQVKPVVITGILPEKETEVSDLKIVSGNLDNLKAGSFGIILGRSLASSLGVLLGDKITVMIPQLDVNFAGMMPRFKRFQVVGIFSAGTGFNFDSKLSFVHINDAQKLLQLGDNVSGMRVKIKNVYQAPNIALELAKFLPADFVVGDWTQQFGAFFSAIKMEKTMMFLILLLIIFVAVFNLVSSLVMVVNDKQSEIAILRTLGATPSTILKIFMVQGSLVGIMGLVLGLISGISLALNATEIVNYLQNTFHTQFISSNTYFVDYLPSKLEWHDVWQVSVIVLLMSFVATIYPAWKASKTQPAEALRYE